MKRRGNSGCVLMLSLFAAALLSSCATGPAGRADSQSAFLAGQNVALRQQQAAQFPGVTIRGPVQNSQVPWVFGLSLAQAIATANYVGTKEPKEIIITRQGENATLDAKVLINGMDIPLEAGDVIELR